jgi:hypothetical protein
MELCEHDYSMLRQDDWLVGLLTMRGRRITDSVADVTPANGLLFRMRIIENILLGAFLVFMPVMLAAVTYALGLLVLCAVRFIPLIGRKHRHADWDRLNR